jgi:hypothetical protein
MNQEKNKREKYLYRAMIIKVITLSLEKWSRLAYEIKNRQTADMDGFRVNGERRREKGIRGEETKSRTVGLSAE